MTKAEDMYPSIIEDVRRNLGAKYDDAALDGMIANMPRIEVLRRYLTWNGIIGYEHTLKDVVAEIYEVELEERV